LSSYAIAFGILGAGLVVAAVLWSRPRLRQRGQVRRFRQQLVHVDIVSLSWAQSLRHQDPSDEVPGSIPELPRPRRGQRRNGRGGGGESLI
jgi:hypothetical protein